MRHRLSSSIGFSFFFNDTATTEIYTLSLHDALPISVPVWKSSLRYSRRASLQLLSLPRPNASCSPSLAWAEFLDRKSTRLHSSHANSSYPSFSLNKIKSRKNRIGDRLIGNKR